LTLPVPAIYFEHWDVRAGRWAVELGTFAFAAGGSSAALALFAETTVSRGGAEGRTP
jgi:hypothetical protein